MRNQSPEESRVFVSLPSRSIVRTILGSVSFTALILSASFDINRSATGTFDAPSVAPGYEATDGDPVDLWTGLYVRNTVDLALGDTLPIVFSRTYRTRDKRPRAFGVGTNHSYGSFLVGDAPAITYIDLILPDGARVHYKRISGGFGHRGAEFEHTSSNGEYVNSRLFWNGNGWTIRVRDGGTYTYPDCPPSLNKACTVSGYRDSKGHEIRMQHDTRMNLIRLETEHGLAIDLTYNDHDQIILARSNAGQEVRYRYDARQRLVGVTNADGSPTTYSYDDRDRMTQVEEPDLTVRNTYDTDERVRTNEVLGPIPNRRGNAMRRLDLFTFNYAVNGGRVTATQVDRMDGRRVVTFNDDGYPVTDTFEAAHGNRRGVAYDRGGRTNSVRRLTAWCSGSSRRRVAVEASLDSEASIDRIERQLHAACEKALKGH
jgi:YD repeat-containing protein